MKTIDNLNITSITFRETKDLYGSGKEYKKRIGIKIENEFNEKLKAISNDIGIHTTEIIRQIISTILTVREDMTNETDL